MRGSRWAAALGPLAAGLWLLTNGGCAPGDDSLPRLSLGANLYEVDPGRFYRSGQLGEKDLRTVVGELGLKTVISLRGYDGDHDWYRVEERVLKELHVPFFSVHLSADTVPHPQEMRALLQLYKQAHRPILVHCDGGADRAGEASAIYQIEYMGRTPEQALEMLSPRFRHFPWLKPAKRHFIARWQGEPWARHDYDPCAPEFRRYYDAERYCRNAEAKPGAG